MATEKDIAGIVAMLSAAYPNWNVTEYTLEIYYQDLKDIPSEELKIAAQHCRSEAGRKFAPSVGELRGAVADLRKYTANIPSSYQAWEEVLRQIVDNGGDYGNPVWSNPIVERAVKMIGWRNLRMSEDATADRARFIQCYEQLAERVSRDEMLIPEVRGYLEVNGARLLAPTDQIKLLAKGMTK
jgi:hypothetical protein